MRALFCCWAVALLGCGHSVEDVCAELAEECESISELNCLNGATELESRALDEGCEDAFDAYLDCVWDSECGWRACDEEQAELEACAGPFPDSE